MDEAGILSLLHETADAVHAALATLDDWGLAGTVPGQHTSDLIADAAALEVLRPAGVRVLSEESGAHGGDDGALLVVIDPLDGSTNASRGIPWYATSLCAVDESGPRAAVVINLATEVCYEAVRGGGARTDGQVLTPSGCTALNQALIGVSGLPPTHFGWRQFRALGAAALDLCAVAAGHLDGYVDCLPDAHGPWDYLAGVLICGEAGAAVADGQGRDLVVRGHGDRRTPVAASTPALLDQLLEGLKIG